MFKYNESLLLLKKTLKKIKSWFDDVDTREKERPKIEKEDIAYILL